MRKLWGAKASNEVYRDPILVCEEPAAETKVGRGSLVAGWAYSPAGIKEVSVWLDGRRVGRAKYRLWRPDVARDHPDWSGILRSGFRYRLKDVPVATSGGGLELLVVAEDRRGRRAQARRTVRVSEPLPDPVLVCDAPRDGTEVRLGTVVDGWAYSPAGIREVSVWLDGRRVGRAEHGLERSDVARHRPGWPGVLHSGFRYRLQNVPAATNGGGSELLVVAEDKRGRRAQARRRVRVNGSLTTNPFRSSTR